MRKRQKPPRYRLHKASGQALVQVNGRRIYLGKYGSDESWEKYQRLIAEAEAQPSPQNEHGLVRLVDDLILAYAQHASIYYQKDGRDTQPGLKPMFRLLKKLYGRTSVADFGPLSLKALRTQMIAEGWSRTTVNDRVNKLKRMFKWGVSEELVPSSVHHALVTVDGLRMGRTVAKDNPPVRPVSDAVVDATLLHLSPVVADMVRFQRLTGCRPGEIRILRPCDVDTSAEVWLYTPSSHKTEHHGKQRIIPIGPRAQDVLRAYLLRPSESYCFSPSESAKAARRARSEARETPLSCGNKPGDVAAKNPKRTPSRYYSKDSYNRAITRAVAKENKLREERGHELLPNWTPNQLRHTAATEVRRLYGLEAAQVSLGHSRADVTQLYAERNLELAKQVAKEVG